VKTVQIVEKFAVRSFQRATTDRANVNSLGQLSVASGSVSVELWGDCVPSRWLAAAIKTK